MSPPKQPVGSDLERRLVTPLDRLSENERDLAGPKAVNLGRMIQAGLPVPAGFCLTTRAFGLWIASSPAALERLDTLQRADRANPESLSVAARGLREVLREVPVPEPVARALDDASLALRLTGALAVRSSASAEDLPEASFAGQHDSFLNVQGPAELREAIRRCWLSLFGDRAVQYRAVRQIAPQAAAMAVVVQEMVPADRAGVIFTADPISGDRSRLVIEGVWGLGEALVSGKTAPDRVVWDRANRHRIAGEKPAAGSQPGAGPLSGLDDETVPTLASLAEQVEGLFRQPQDIEWAARDGQVLLLQARPITTRPQPAPPAHGIWIRANVCESFPGVATPMTWSVVEELFLRSVQDLLRVLGIKGEDARWLGLFAGRVYLNAGITRDLLGGPLLAELRVHELLGGPAYSVAPASPGRAAPGTLRLLTRALSHPILLINGLVGVLRQDGSDFLNLLRRRVAELGRTNFAELPDQGLATFPLELGRRIFPEIDYPSAATRAATRLLTGLACSFLVRPLAHRWLADPDGRMANRLLTGADEMASAQAARDLWRLADWARGRPALAALLLQAQDFHSACRRLETLPDGSQFLEQWRQFLATHGHHTRGELDVHNPRWAELPDHILSLVRTCLAADNQESPFEQRTRRSRARWALLADFRRRLRNPLKRWCFIQMVQRGQRGLAFRENIKNEAICAVATVRRALLEAGDRLSKRGLLENREDVFFLDLHELKQTLTGQASFDVPNTITARKAEYRANQEVDPPMLILGRSELPPASWSQTPSDGARFTGLAVSPGVAVGKARVILEHDTGTRLLPGEILVAPFTDTGWTPYFLNAAAIVVDIGGQLSHGSILAREYGLPAVVNVHSATKLIRTGQPLRVDGNEGTVSILDPG